MSETDKKLAEILNIDVPVVDVPVVETKQITKVDQDVAPTQATANADTDSDYSVVRNNLKRLIVTSELAIDGIMNVAEEGDSPRAYEVVSDLIKTALDANNRLMELHKTMKDIRKDDNKASKGDTVTNNSIFVGNTNDLLKMIRQKKIPLPPQTDIVT
jgi:hypothetical protein